MLHPEPENWRSGSSATASRKALVERAIVDDILISGYHFGFPNSGKIKRDGRGYVFDAVRSNT